MRNIIIDCDDFSFCMIDKELIKQICKYTQNVKNAGNYIPLKSRHEAYWINKLENNELWNDKNGYLALIDKNDILFGIIWHFSHCIENSYEIGLNIINPKFRIVKGFGPKALRKYTDYLFNVYPINRLQANTAENNLSSEKMIQSVGFKYEGMQRKAIFIRGKWENLKLYSLLREEWEQNAI